MASKYPSFTIARQSALELHMESKGAYIRWHKEHNPAYLPRYPDRVYTKEFVSWNDFLGTQTVFKGTKEKIAPDKYRPYWEAVKWAQHNAAVYDINTGVEWVAWCKNCADKVPNDIPKSPEQHYNEFKGNGWSVWLGQDVRAKLKAHGMPTHLFAICSHENLNVPGNYYKIIHASNGSAELKEKLSAHKDMKVFRAYKWDDAIAEDINKLIASFSKDMGEGKVFIPNLNTLIFELDMLLEFVIVKKKAELVEVELKERDMHFADHMYKVKL